MNFKKLYRPYEGIATVDMTIGWVHREAQRLGIKRDIAEKAINDTFLEMEGGKKFPTDGGDTGLDNIPNAALDHYILKKAILFNKVATDAYNKATQGILHTRMELIIKNENSRLKKFLNCNNSEFIKIIAPILSSVCKPYIKWRNWSDMKIFGRVRD